MESVRQHCFMCHKQQPAAPQEVFCVQLVLTLGEQPPACNTCALHFLPSHHTGCDFICTEVGAVNETDASVWVRPEVRVAHLKALDAYGCTTPQAAVQTAFEVGRAGQARQGRAGHGTAGQGGCMWDGGAGTSLLSLQ